MKNKDIFVIKLGSNVLLDNGGIDKKVIQNVVSGVQYLRKYGAYVLLVSSGAVAMGKQKMNRDIIKGLSPIESGQVFSSVGQVALINTYQDYFNFFDITVSQALLTRKDFSDRERYNSMKSVLLKTLESGVIPIINENDVLSQEELDFSDNDELSALLAAMIGSNNLIILSNIKGLYDSFPGGNLIKEINEVNESTYDMVGTSKSSYGKGGMASKLNTASLVMDLGINMYLADGKESHIIEKIFNGENPGTVFRPNAGKKVDSMRKWLKAGAVPTGRITVSTIISDLLKSGKRASLLEIGIESIELHFDKKEVVEVCDEDGISIGYGIAKISSRDIDRDSESNRVVVHTDYFIKK